MCPTFRDIRTLVAVAATGSLPTRRRCYTHGVMYHHYRYCHLSFRRHADHSVEFAYYVHTRTRVRRGDDILLSVVYHRSQYNRLYGRDQKYTTTLVSAAASISLDGGGGDVKPRRAQWHDIPTGRGKIFSKKKKKKPTAERAYFYFGFYVTTSQYAAGRSGVQAIGRTVIFFLPVVLRRARVGDKCRRLRCVSIPRAH